MSFVQRVNNMGDSLLAQVRLKPHFLVRPSEMKRSIYGKFKILEISECSRHTVQHATDPTETYPTQLPII